MTSQDFEASVALIIVVMAMVSLVELAVPLFARRADSRDASGGTC
jgi:hypothetical protein